jgi:hypothetical protein
MILPVQTTFRNMDASAAVAARVQEEADKLDKYFDRITSCRVIVEAPHRHHRRGEPFHIRIELGVPGKELVVTHVPTLAHEDQGEWHKHLEVMGPHKDVYVATGLTCALPAPRRCEDALSGAARESQQAFRRKATASSRRQMPRDLLHRNSVLNSAFEHLDIGDEVIFSKRRRIKACARPPSGWWQASPDGVPEE